MWLSSMSLNSGLRPVSNSTARSGNTVGVVAFVNKPKYWLESALGGVVVLQRTKARPNPGLLVIGGNTEKMKEVEKEEMFAELEKDFMGTFVG